MTLFLSTYINKIDKKGRVSVPSIYRSVISSQHFNGIIVYKSFVNECIEACSFERIEYLNNSIDQLDPYSDTRDAFASIILGGSMQLPFDTEGRVILPENLIEEAGIEDKVCFVGKGKTFEIWCPDKFNQHLEKARLIAKENRDALKINNK